MVKVACHIENGLMLNLFQQVYDDGTGSGVKMVGRDGPGVRLNGPRGTTGGVNPGAPPPGITEVNDLWWEKWLRENKQNALVAQRHVYAVEATENPT